MVNLPNELSLREIAFRLCGKQSTDSITDDEVDKTLCWLIDAVNSQSLKAWHKDQCNLCHSLEAKKQNANEIYVTPYDLRAYLGSRIDELQVKGVLTYTKKYLKHAKRHLDLHN